MGEANTSSRPNIMNYMKLLNVLNTTATSFLREWFSKKWFELSKSAWEHDEASGIEFIEGRGKSLFTKSQKIQKKYLKSGNIQCWDLPLLMDAIKCLLNEAELEVIKNDFDDLRKVRNYLSHLGNIDIESEKFEKLWEEVSRSLHSLGVETKDLELAKSFQFGQEVISSTEKLNKINEKKAEEFKEVGNTSFKLEKYMEAIESYTKAINLPGIPSNLLGILYANRSLSYLKVGDLYSAKVDAKFTVNLSPNWWKGHARLANSYVELKKYKKALQENEIALWMKPGDSYVRDSRDFCIYKMGILSREEHLDPSNHATLFRDPHSTIGPSPIINEAYGRDMQRRLYNMGTSVGICGEALKYLQGDNGTPQNYQMAANLFAKAAAKGSTEAMYNLGCLTMDGNGIKRNVPRAIRMWLLVAEQEPYKETGDGSEYPNIGVMEAQHALGIACQEGSGMPQDFSQALSWYYRALLNGSSNSAVNIGMMFLRGDGLERSLEKAFIFFKIAALKGNIRAMENLVDQYFIRGDKISAKKWYTLAVDKGSIMLPLRAKELKIDEVPMKGFKSVDFIEDLKEELLNIPYAQQYVIPHKYSFESLLKGMVENDDKKNKLDPLSLDYKKQIILAHRTFLKKSKSGAIYASCTTQHAPPALRASSELIGLKSIFLRSMNQTEDHIYEGFAIKLTLIEDAVMGGPSIALVGQDENGDVQRIFVYNYPQNNDTLETLGYGCRIAIVNPYFRITADRDPAIRVDDTSLLFPCPKLRNEKRCRYCGNEAGVFICRKCKRVYYCSKLCLKNDDEILNHKLVCFKHI